MYVVHIFLFNIANICQYINSQTNNKRFNQKLNSRKG